MTTKPHLISIFHFQLTLSISNQVSGASHSIRSFSLEQKFKKFWIFKKSKPETEIQVSPFVVSEQQRQQQQQATYVNMENFDFFLND